MLVQIRVYGIVQGVGFRPTVSRHAREYHIFGSVCNKGPYVEIFAQGERADVEKFIDAVRNRSPKRSIILKMDCKERAEEESYQEFSIIESEKTTGAIFVSPDIAVCEDCKEEMYQKGNRRYLHPFINCTCCGPRLTILDRMPYDRERTSMSEFPMCTDCEREYTTMDDRRYDAQPVCCNACGPDVYMVRGKERDQEAIRRTREIISHGEIVAVKGIGGFHLCCDASNEQAVSLLRQRKNRPDKPFAVMMRDMETVRRECELEPGQEEILTGHQKPILLLNKKKGGRLCESIAPGNPKVGVMLPYAPVQLLLFDYDDERRISDMLVMTSGNISGAPICRTDEDVEEQLGKLCEDILSHNRKIRLRADDSVMDFYDGKPYMIRRSRGYAPLPVMLKEAWKGEVLAAGGELKNCFCIARDDLFYLSPYIGDMEDVRTVRAFHESVLRMEQLLEVFPKAIACDAHPKYQSAAEAQKLEGEILKIQHHYAHVVSCMAENDEAGPVLGVAMDGTGYGLDGTIWGGEFLRADYQGFTRVGHIRPFLQVGGDAASKEGWRMAVSMIYSLYGKEKGSEWIERLNLCDQTTAQVQYVMAEKKINSINSTSAGRLFDAVSAILGLCKSSSYEGCAAVRLQFAAQQAAEKRRDFAIPTGRTEEGCYILATDQLVREMVEERLEGKDAQESAWRFHYELAGMIAEACHHLCERENLSVVALSGGVFQNTLLLDLCKKKLEKEGKRVLIHSMVPPNDGGIALGQAVTMMSRMNIDRKEGKEECV